MKSLKNLKYVLIVMLAMLLVGCGLNTPVDMGKVDMSEGVMWDTSSNVITIPPGGIVMFGEQCLQVESLEGGLVNMYNLSFTAVTTSTLTLDPIEYNGEVNLTSETCPGAAPVQTVVPGTFATPASTTVAPTGPISTTSLPMFRINDGDWSIVDPAGPNGTDRDDRWDFDESALSYTEIVTLEVKNGTVWVDCDDKCIVDGVEVANLVPNDGIMVQTALEPGVYEFRTINVAGPAAYAIGVETTLSGEDR